MEARGKAESGKRKAGDAPCSEPLHLTAPGTTQEKAVLHAPSARSQHTGLVHCLMMDGSDHSVSDSIDDNVWVQMHGRFPK